MRVLGTKACQEQLEKGVRIATDRFGKGEIVGGAYNGWTVRVDTIAKLVAMDRVVPSGKDYILKMRTKRKRG